MPFRFYQTLTLAFACSLLLAGCETAHTGMKAHANPTPLQNVDNKEVAQDTDLHTTIGDDSAEKIARLEKQVAALQEEVVAARPKLAKIDVIEEKFKDLSLGLDKIDRTYKMAPAVGSPESVAAAPVSVEKPAEHKMPPKPVAVSKPPVLKPSPKPAPKAEAKKEAFSIPAEKTVTGLRIGEQKGFTRLVIDVSQSVKLHYDIDNDEKILLVDIPGFTWAGAKTKTFAGSPLIASYQVQSDQSGAHLVVQLKKAAKITSSSMIEAASGKNPRAIVDVAATTQAP